MRPKRNYTLPFVAIATTGTLAFYYSYFSKERFDNFQTVRRKTKYLGNLEQTKETIEYLKRHLEHYKKIEGENSHEVAFILLLLAHHYLQASEDKLEGIRYGEESIEVYLQLGLKHLVLSQLDLLTEVVREVSPTEASRLAQKSREYKRKYGYDAILQNFEEAYCDLQENDMEAANQHFDAAKVLLDSLDPSTERLGEAYSLACFFFTRTRDMRIQIDIVRKRLNPLRISGTGRVKKA